MNRREPHGLKPNYIEMGHDATVTDDGRNDLVFTNTTGADIYVVARVETSGKTKRCLFQFYGRPDPNGYTYSLSSETIETIPIPEATIIQDKKAEYVIYTDQTKEVSKGSEGYVVRTYLLTKDASGNTINTRELYTDTYKATAPKIYVGVTPKVLRRRRRGERGFLGAGASFWGEKSPGPQTPTPRKPLFYVGSEKRPTGYLQPVILLCAESKKNAIRPSLRGADGGKRLSWEVAARNVAGDRQGACDD